MSDFQTQVEVLKDQALAKMRRWSDEQSAKKIHREYLSEEGMFVKSGSRLEELLDERHRIALTAAEPEVRLKAINSSLDMAAGSEKITNIQNNHYDFGDFLNKCED
jgi:hypothetical protein